MSNLQKVYKLILNMLESHADLTFYYNHDLQEYQLARLGMKIGWWSIFINVIDLPYICTASLYCNETEQSWLMVMPDDIDKFLDGLSESYFDFLLEGIE